MNIRLKSRSLAPLARTATFTLFIDPWLANGEKDTLIRLVSGQITGLEDDVAIDMPSTGHEE